VQMSKPNAKIRLFDERPSSVARGNVSFSRKPTSTNLQGMATLSQTRSFTHEPNTINEWSRSGRFSSASGILQLPGHKLVGGGNPDFGEGQCSTQLGRLGGDLGPVAYIDAADEVH